MDVSLAVQRTCHFCFMSRGGATMGAGGHYPPPCKGAGDRGSKYIVFRLTVNINVNFPPGRGFLLNFLFTLAKITSITCKISSFNTGFILKSSCNFLQASLYFYPLRFLYSLLKSVLYFQSRHNSHTGHCYVISFAVARCCR